MSGGSDRQTGNRLRDAGPYRHVVLARLIAGVPLFTIGLAHVFVPEAAMRPMVEAAGFPAPAVVSLIGVAIQIVAGLSLLLGWWARIGGLLGVLSMLGAIYAHIVIDVWPGEVPEGPPDALPVVVLLGSGYVAWRGAGRWSLDRWTAARGTGTGPYLFLAGQSSSSGCLRNPISSSATS